MLQLTLISFYITPKNILIYKSNQQKEGLILQSKFKSIHIPIELHTKLKLKATAKEMKLRDLIIEALEKSLKEDKE